MEEKLQVYCENVVLESLHRNQCLAKWLRCLLGHLCLVQILPPLHSCFLLLDTLRGSR